jgi:phytoene synthase
MTAQGGGRGCGGAGSGGAGSGGAGPLGGAASSGASCGPECGCGAGLPSELRLEIEHAIQDGWRLCEEITRTEARNFYYGLRLLPKDERSALYVVYAWMRVLDDIADGVPPDVAPDVAADVAADVTADAARAGVARAPSRRDLLDRFERETRGVFDRGWYEAAGRELSEHGTCSRERLVLLALAQEVRLHGLRIDDFLGAVEGQRMDLEPRVYASFAETERYCDRVASTVGRICLDVWGVRAGADAARARELSTARGIAFQLTNILRDLREDHARGRCYLPADELAAHGLTADALVAWSDDARCTAFMRDQCLRAASYFDGSAELEELVGEKAVPTLAAMTAIYRGILDRIARDPRRAIGRRVSLSFLAKTSIALRARFGLLGRARRGRA